jgi:hypothetical protein
MKSLSGLIVFTDLDGTLLDHDTYEWQPAMLALDTLKARDIPLVLVSSKTLAELRDYRAQLGLAHPIVAENGAATDIPDGYFPESTFPEGTVPRAELQSVYREVKQAGGFDCEAFFELGIAGIVADGCVRDAQEIRASGFPLFCAGLSPNGPFKEGPGEINYPISCGGQIVRPGDMIIGDDDGVVVLQKELAAATIDKVYQVIQREENRLKEIADGQVIRPGIDEMLEKKGIIP